MTVTHAPSAGASAARSGTLVDEVGSSGRHEHGVDRGSQPGNFYTVVAHRAGRSMARQRRRLNAAWVDGNEGIWVAGGNFNEPL
jgi:hypothetical protein